MKFNFFAMFVVFSIMTHMAIWSKSQLDIEEKRSEILKDQIADMQNQLIEKNAQKTYEEGVRDGIQNRRDRSYMEGYHMATQHSQGLLPSLNEIQITNQEQTND